MSKPRLIGQLQVPGDKSITHRALIFAALCAGESEIAGAAMGEDCRSTMRCLQELGLGVEVDMQDESDTSADASSGATTLYDACRLPVVRIKSNGLQGLRAPHRTLDVGNSGTTMRLLAGLLAGTNISCVIDGDESIRRRPMKRIFEPLTLMGARFPCLEEPGHAPFKLQGAPLHAIDYVSPVASAQVETAFILAALQATHDGAAQVDNLPHRVPECLNGRSTISLPGPVRDHTVRLLQYMNIPIAVHDSSVSVTSLISLNKPITPYKIKIPGDLSSAAFFMVAATLLPGSDITLHGVGINPGRCLIIDTMLEMGANITIENRRNYAQEPAADIRIKYSPGLKSATISGAQIALGIDEIPVLALLGCFCEGSFRVQGAAELRYKESDRLQSIIENLRNAGVAVTQQEDGFEITAGIGGVDGTSTRGGSNSSRLKGGCSWATHGDHRLAMTGIVAGLLSKEPIEVDDVQCIGASYPAFKSDLQKLLC